MINSAYCIDQSFRSLRFVISHVIICIMRFGITLGMKCCLVLFAQEAVMEGFSRDVGKR